MNIGTLTIEMAANVARLQQDLRAARGSVDSTFASIGSSVAKLKALVGTVFAGIAVGELLGAVDKVKTAAVDIERIAAASGASLDEFQRAAAGAKTVGVNLEKFGDIMKDTQDKLGDFLLTGGGELKDFFETIGPKVGVTAESFRNLSGPQALQLFYTSLEKANVGQKVMIQQMESIANDASMLAPLLANGGAEFKSLGEEAAKAGALMSSELIYASKNLGSEMSRLDTVVGGITNSIMEGLIPVMAEMAAASREDLSAGFEAVSAWVQDNKDQLLGAWELTKSIGAEVWSIVKVAIELAVGIGKWAVESGFLEASLITIGLLVAGFKDGVDIVGAAFAKLGSIILNAVAKPMSGFLNDVGVVLKWAGQGDLAGVFLDAAEGIKTAGEAGAQYAAGVADKFAAGDTAVARFTAGLGASTQAAQAAAKSTYTAYQALGTGAGISAKAAEEAKKSADKAAAAAQKLAEEGVKLAASLLAQDSGLSGDFAAKWDKLNAAYKAGAVSLADLTQAQKLLLAEQPAMKAAADAQKKALEEEAQAWSDVRSAMLAYRHAQEQAAQSVADGNQALRDEIELIGLSSKERARVLQQRTQAIILTKQATLAEMERQSAITGTATREQIALAAEIEGLQERNELLGAQEARESWTGFWESVNSTAHDTFVDVANNGMSAFKRIGQTLKSAVLDMLYQMTIKKWIVSIGASVGGIGGMAQAASATASTLGAAGDAGSLLSAGSALSSLGAFGGAVSGFGTAALSAAQTMVGMTGTVAQMTTSLAAAGHTAASGLAAGVQAFQMIPGWGWALAGIALLAGSGLGKTRGANHGGGIYSSAGLSDQDAAQSIAGGLGWKDPVTDFTTRGNAALSGQVKTAVDSLLEVYAGLGALAKGTVADLEVVAGFAVNGKHKDEDVYGYFKIFNQMTGELLNAYSNREMGKDGDAAWAQYVADLGTAMVQQLMDADIPSWMNSILSELGDAPTLEGLSAAVAEIQKIDAVFGVMSLNLDGFAAVSDTAREAMIAAAGGIDNLAGAASAYYDIFYSDAQKLANSTRDVGQVFQDLGLEVPTTNAGLRTLIEQQQAMGKEGAAAAVKLMGVAPAFGAVTKATAAQEKAYKSIAVSLGLVIGKSDDYIAKLAEQAGGGDDLLQQSANYYNNFYTEAERAQATINEATAALAALGVEMPTTRQGFNDVMNAAIGMGDAGINLVAALLMAADGADLFIGKLEGVASAGASGGGPRGANGVALDPSTYQIREIPESAAQGLLRDVSIKSHDTQKQMLKALESLGKVIPEGFSKIADEANAMRADPAYAAALAGSNLNATALDQYGINQGIRDQILSREIPGGVFTSPVFAEGDIEGVLAKFKSITLLPATILQQFEDQIDTFNAGAKSKADFDTLLWQLEDMTKYADYYTSTAIGRTNQAVKDQKELEQAIQQWTFQQARLYAVEDMNSLIIDTKSAIAKSEEILASGGLIDPIKALTAKISQKLQDVNDGVGAALKERIDALAGKEDPLLQAALDNAESNLAGWTDPSKLAEKIAAAQKEVDDYSAASRNAINSADWDFDKDGSIGRALRETLAQLQNPAFAAGMADNAQALVDLYRAEILALTDPAQRAALQAEIDAYEKTIKEWGDAQKKLMSAEMLVDINRQINDLEAAEIGPLATIKQAIQKYIDNLTELGNLDAGAQAAIDKLSGLQLTKARKSLYDQLLSPEELKTSNEYDLTMQFMGLGAAMPASTAALRDMIDAAQAAGNITLADSLLELVPAFVALQGAAGGLSDALGDALKTAQKSTDDAFSALQRAIDAQRKTLGTQLTAAQELQREVSSVFDSLKSAVSDLYRSVDSTAQQSAATARAFIANALSGALATGSLPDSKELQDAIAAARGGMDGKQYASQFAADRDRLVLAGQLDALKAVGGKQLTEAERQIRVLQEQLDALDLTLQAARTQIDVMRGVDVSVISVEAAVQALGVSMAAETAAILALAAAATSRPPAPPPAGGGGGGGGYTAPSYIDSAYQALFGREADTAGAAYWQGTGLTGSALIDAMVGGAQGSDLDSLPKFAVGTNNVPRDMYAQIHEGEAIIPKAFNPWAGGGMGGGSTARLEALVEVLTEKVGRLEAVIAQGNSSTRQLADQFDEVTEGGRAMRRGEIA